MKENKNEIKTVNGNFLIFLKTITKLKKRRELIDRSINQSIGQCLPDLN